MPPDSVPDRQPDAAQIEEARRTLIAFGREFAALGMLPATSGNLSMRLGADHALMTRSGIEKGELGVHDFLLAALDQAAPTGSSAEAPLHLALYRQFTDAGCVLHVHSRPAAVLSRRVHEAGGDTLVLQGWELQKAIEGQHSHEQALKLPVFANDQDTLALAHRVRERLAGGEPPRAYLLAGHGLYAWGRDARAARRHVIALESLLQGELDLRMTT